MTSRLKNPKQSKSSVRSDKDQGAQLTFLDHIRELQWRLFVVVGVFLTISAAVYPFFEKIVALLLEPLGKKHELVYLTPGGAFSFIIQVCLYVGLVGTLPFIIYHLYRFIMPAVQKVKIWRVLGYTLTSLLLALTGIVFAYVVSLPAALYFLTGFNLYHINPMLTIDSYLSFVMTYLLAGALLFQLPLVMIIINTITPLKPSKLMKAQDKIILGSFIVAAVISPTPDALNQTLLASPMIVMYQLGIIIIWWKNRRLNHKASESLIATKQETVEPRFAPVFTTTKIITPIASKKPQLQRSLDGIRGHESPRLRVPTRSLPLNIKYPSSKPVNSSSRERAIDGVSLMT